MRVAIKDIGLAAYLKANGAQIVEYRLGAWVFESLQSLSAWRMAYTNSCCRKHDLELLELRRIARDGQVDTL